MNALRPPGELRRRADEIGAALQRDAPLRLGVLHLQLLDAGKMLAKCWLAKTVFVSGSETNRCSAGCSSGECGGRSSKWTCSGTRTRGLACPVCPARAVEHDLFGETRPNLLGERVEFD
jgi:hypothetical protein